MSEDQSPKAKKTRGAPKSFAEKIGAMAEAKRKQVAKLKERLAVAARAYDQVNDELKVAEGELKKLEAATGAAS